jgi:hypothetical protein
MNSSNELEVCSSLSASNIVPLAESVQRLNLDHISVSFITQTDLPLTIIKRVFGLRP